MGSPPSDDRPQPPRRSRSMAANPIALGAVAAFVTAGVVSWATPDGNLVVTGVPALAVGALVFGLARWLR